MPLFADGVPRPDHGPGFHNRLCATCGASWVGQADEWCGWCEAAQGRQKAAQRLILLDPPQLRSDAGHHRYEALDDIDRAIWDRTRGQQRGADSVVAWAARLRRAVDSGLITNNEAEAAMRKVARR
jgi:hypothetical protein